MKTEFTSDWKNWIQTNIDNGVDKDQIFFTLIDEGFSFDAISQEMQHKPTLKTEFTQDWLNWIETNVSAGNDKNGIFKILLNHGFSYDAIRAKMNFEPTVPADKLVDPRSTNIHRQEAPEITVFGTPLS